MPSASPFGPVSADPRAPHGNPELPPLVLTCRAGWRLAFFLASLALLGIGTAALADRGGADAGVPVPLAVILLLAGAGCAYFAARYCLSRLILDESGFRLVGPLGSDHVRWDAVVRWESRRPPTGPGVVRIVHGPEGRRLSIPLIYEDSHALVIGLGQGRFPRY